MDRWGTSYLRGSEANAGHGSPERCHAARQDAGRWWNVHVSLLEAVQRPEVSSEGSFAERCHAALSCPIARDRGGREKSGQPRHWQINEA